MRYMQDLGRITLLASFFRLCIAAVSKSQLSNCPLLSAQYPTNKDLHRSGIIKNIRSTFQQSIDVAVSSGKTAWGKIDSSNSSFSLGVFTTSSNDLLFEYHNEGSNLDGTLSADSLTNQTVYRVGSVTKLLTVYTILITLGPSYWTEPVINFVPELSGATTTAGWRHPVNWSEVTLGALASHMGGIARDSGYNDISDIPGLANLGFPRLNDSEIPHCGGPITPFCSKYESLRFIQQQNAVTRPWVSPVYSNEAFQILAMAVENITGEDFGKSFQEAIIKRLGLTKTFWRRPQDMSDIIDVKLDDPIEGHAFDYDLGIYTPTGGAYSSLADLSAIGRSILRSSLLPLSTTHEWLKPSTFVAHKHGAVGKPWEIFRMEVPMAPASQSTRLIDLYTKNGAIGAYLSYIILIPEYDLGFVVLLASTESPSAGAETMGALTEMLLDAWVPAAESAAREAAGVNIAGLYTSEDAETNSTLKLVLKRDRGGLRIEQLVYNGTDFLATMQTLAGVTGGDLHYMDGTQDGQSVAFRAVWSRPVEDDEEDDSKSHRWVLGKRCLMAWGGVDVWNYGNFGLDEFIFSTDEFGFATTVTLPALRVTLHRAIDQGAYQGPDQQIIL
ncbi:beta-lactamase/transpeptidase-like protein [Xylariales sp. PMI_506]|nr:beta-lactamase/transpeptidase-like protein [Xylariales sp. PMI_506]